MGADIQTFLKGREVQPNKRSRDIMTKVTKDDREAAQALCASGWTHAIDAFARHREASTEALRAENARLREALETAAVRLEVCAAWHQKPSARGTLNAERGMKAWHMAQEARAALENRDD